MRGEVRTTGDGRAAGDGGVTSVQGWARLKAVGARARAGRTRNMAFMNLTLDVSKFSGWLNADACCRVKRRACDAWRGAGQETGGRGVVAAQVTCTGIARLKAVGAYGTRGAHIKHVTHACDAGRVKA